MEKTTKCHLSCATPQLHCRTCLPKLRHLMPQNFCLCPTVPFPIPVRNLEETSRLRSHFIRHFIHSRLVHTPETHRVSIVLLHLGEWLGVVLLKAFDVVLGHQRAEFKDAGYEDTDGDLDGGPEEYWSSVD